MTNKKRALGKGLAAILSSPDTDITSSDISGNYVVGAIADINLDRIEANPFQPRDKFDADSLQELAESIASQGIIQPITVRKLGYDKYQLISGERRYKAARIAGLKEIPCYIRVANDEQMLEMALVENIHRESLNAIEIAISYQRLIEECQITHEKLSERVGKNRSTITNFLRLLKLPAEVQIAVRDEKISMGHARALINIEDEKQISDIVNTIISEELSVRQVEELVKYYREENKSDRLEKPAQKTKNNQKNPLPERFQMVKNHLDEKFGTTIELKVNNKGKGQIVIPFLSEQELDVILGKIDIEKQTD